MGPLINDFCVNYVLSSRSESPRVQQILLHQKLREEIEKNSSGKVRYVDSELYLRNQERSQASAGSEVQSATLNIGLVPSSTIQTTTNFKQSSRIPINSISSIATTRDSKLSNRDDQHQQQHHQMAGVSMPKGDAADMIVSENNGQHRRESNAGSADCQVCRVKEVREDLMKLNKMIQERNVHFSELKAKCLRSYFRRQVID